MVGRMAGRAVRGLLDMFFLIRWPYRYFLGGVFVAVVVAATGIGPEPTLRMVEVTVLLGGVISVAREELKWLTIDQMFWSILGRMVMISLGHILLVGMAWHIWPWMLR